MEKNSLRDTINRVRRTVSKYDMIRYGDGVVVAVSGGPDSVCLLDILHELQNDLGIELVVAHFDHGLRPDEDETETRFVEALAGSLNLPFETKKAGPGLQSGGTSSEERARHARYGFLEEVKGKFSAHKIAVGHNLNDQAETVLMRILRGSGLSGLSGISPCRDRKIIRPLIEVSREKIESYLEQRGLTYVTDSSNLETRYLRNRIRLQLLPQLKIFQPRIVELLGQMADIIRRDDEQLEAEAKDWLDSVAEINSNEEIQVPISFFTELPEGLRNRGIRHVLKMIRDLRRVGMRHIDAVNRVATGNNPHGQVNLPHGLIVKRVYDKLVFTMKKDKEAEGFCYSLDGPGTFRLDALGSTISLEEMEKRALEDINTSALTVFLNADHLAYPLMIRNLLPGDKFVPLGMSGHKKLKDFFIDLKIPLKARGHIPILTCRNLPIWVCGFRIDDRFRITPDTRRILKVTITCQNALTFGRG